MIRFRIHVLLTAALSLTLLWGGCGPPVTLVATLVPEPTLPPDAPTLPAGARSLTYYVRPDGGSPTECTGLTDAAYAGSGTGQDCAWDHPFRALPPGGPARIAGGDTLIIGAGSFMMGYGAPEADRENDACAADYPWDCHMPPIPSGPDAAHPTRILGAGWDAGCPAPPELWGTERAAMVINLTGSSNVEIACLEITDHSACVEEHAGPEVACERSTAPYGPWAADGLVAADAGNVTLRHLNIHGLAAAGVRAGRLTDWLVEDTRIATNGWVGWEGDLGENSANTGTLTFRRWVVEWNGCGETYPGEVPTACWTQPAGGYGDGVGTGATGGDWTIEDSAFLHNTSDGLDLLYHELGGTVTLNRIRAEGNAGNQVKVTGAVQVLNSVLVGNCTFFEDQPFVYSDSAIDHCRALGNALEITYTGGEAASIINTTIYGQGDGLVAAGPRAEGDCNGSETLTGRNNLFHGDADTTSPGEITFLFYQAGCEDLIFEGDYSLAYTVKNVEAPWVDPPYPGGHNLLEDPLLAGPLSGEAYGMRLTTGSPAIDAGDAAACPPVDIEGTPRPIDGDEDGDAVCDIGAHEYRPPSSWIYLPLATRATTLAARPTMKRSLRLRARCRCRPAPPRGRAG